MNERRAALPPDCEELFRRVRAGDREAFDLLRRHLLPPIERFAARLIGPGEDRTDIVREAMLALWVSRDRLAGPDSLLPFAYRVARNTAYDILRARGRFDVLSGDSMRGEPFGERRMAPTPGPEETMIRLTLWQEVQEAMDRLPELQRQTMILYAEEDFTYQQIAEAMATDIGTVRSRLFHARRNLKRHLRPDTCVALGLNTENDRQSTAGK
ncbi:MAG: sigma-70 family RNA polymerase sigma factor [Capsulimonadales bacterium]|nr:sigma-70 family RNA polymerase sigma factor [Capsulimonadales bacterium]